MGCLWAREDIRLLVVENPQDLAIEDFFDSSDNEVIEMFAVPHRWTILHQFIQDFYTRYCVFGFENDRDDMLDLVIMEYQAVLKGYDISYESIELPDQNSPLYDEFLLDAVSYLRSLLPIRRIANETFQLLFGDRGFLLRFNSLVSAVVSKLELKDHPNILTRDGALKRYYLPVWARRGIFFRDQGRCVNCGKDLTGTIVTGEELHYDHIIPLADGGTNDPTNMQLMCRDCNLTKATGAYTSNKYPVYWSIDD